HRRRTGRLPIPGNPCPGSRHPNPGNPCPIPGNRRKVRGWASARPSGREERRRWPSARPGRIPGNPTSGPGRSTPRAWIRSSTIPPSDGSSRSTCVGSSLSLASCYRSLFHILAAGLRRFDLTFRDFGIVFVFDLGLGPTGHCDNTVFLVRFREHHTHGVASLRRNLVDTRPNDLTLLHDDEDLFAVLDD